MEDAQVPEDINEWQQVQVQESSVHLTTSDPLDPQDSFSPSTYSSSSSSNFVHDNHVGSVGKRLKYLRFEFLRAVFVRVTSKVRNCSLCAGSFLSVMSMTGIISAVLMSLIYVRMKRWRRRVHQQSMDRLVFLLREKDEKIRQLLLQIAQMNEVLSTRSKATGYSTRPS
ncbi:SKI/DACH domain-containing protein [Quillaja saponaria]|uniref:SKI/DACH domain-containing protein n=1 Tax=Quillaja saponaria TaxID=32244 RepID=A0AAD7KPQ9_QUISA|nr:SKI/DACH domain-containing protein [Quillaja saponaria]